MNYRQLESEVISAYRQRDKTVCFSLLDSFITSATGKDLGLALCLRAEMIMFLEKKRAAEGILLVDEALSHLDEHPAERMMVIISALGLCWTMGDVERARNYELLGHQILRDFASDPGILAKQFRLHLNLGLLAKLRGELAAAYWHFMQGVGCISSRGADDGRDQCWLFNLYEQMIAVCLSMNRIPEAQDYVDRAKECITSPVDSVRWNLALAQVLRHTGRVMEAQDVLATLPPESADGWTPTSIALSHLVRALLYQDEGNIRGFHHHLFLAQKEAVSHHLDYLVCEIQRVQRAPLTQGVAK